MPCQHAPVRIVGVGDLFRILDVTESARGGRFFESPEC